MSCNIVSQDIPGRYAYVGTRDKGWEGGQSVAILLSRISTNVPQQPLVAGARNKGNDGTL